MNLLIIDDDKDDQFFFKEMIRDIDNSIVCNAVNDGIKGFEYLEHFEAPDMIFLDLNMPNMNGFDFLKVIDPELVKRIPIIIYTTSNYPPDIEKAKELGAKAFLTKPNSLKELAVCLNKVVSFDFMSLKDEMLIIKAS